jgi:hypothetical protein
MKPCTRTILSLAAASSVLAAAVVPGARAQSGCLRMDTVPPRATVTLHRGLLASAAAPGVYCGLDAGTAYRVVAWMPNYEGRAFKVTVRPNGERAGISGIRTGYVSRALVPGWGLGALGYKGSAVYAIGSISVGGLNVLQDYLDWDAEKQTRDLLVALLDFADTQEQVAYLQKQIDLRQRNVEAYEENLIYTAAFTGWWYLGSIVETWYLASPPRTRALDAENIEVRLIRRSGWRAGALSFLFPGTGQRYNGSYTKALLVQGGFLVTGLLALDRKLLYDLRKVDYDLAYQEFLEAPTEEERLRAQLTAAVRWDSMEEKRRQMVGWAIASGSIWLINVIDAAVSGGKEEWPNRFDVETSYRAGVARTGLRVRF